MPTSNANRAQQVTQLPAPGGTAEEIMQAAVDLEQHRDDLMQALTDLVNAVKQRHPDHERPHVGLKPCLRCLAVRIAEEYGL